MTRNSPAGREPDPGAPVPGSEHRGDGVMAPRDQGNPAPAAGNTAPVQGNPGQAPVGTAPAVPSPRTPPLDPSAPLPDDPQALAEDIRQTREQLGAALEALLARTDVKARAREKAGQVSGRVRGVTSRAGSQARGQLAAGPSAARRHLPLVLAVTAAAGAVAVVGYLAATRWRRE